MKILGVKVNNISLTGAVGEVRKFLYGKNGKIFTLFTPNPEIIVQAQGDGRLRRILNEADLAVPDGVGVVWASEISQKSKVKSQKLAKPVPGVKLMEELCRAAAGKGWKVGLYGGRDGTAEEALNILKNRYPGLKGWARTASQFEIRDSKLEIRRERGIETEMGRVLGKIKKTKTRILFVGLGAPKQEYFIERIKNHEAGIKNIRIDKDRNNYPLILMSVGGSFDEIAGRVRPAPSWINRAGLKWLWRLAQEPRRIGRQTRLVQYILLVLYGRFKRFLGR